MVDVNSQSIWACVGCPGSNHNSIIFRSTGLFTKLMEGINVLFMILADSDFSHLPWLQKPYTNAVLTEKRFFDYRLNQTRLVIEHVYGILK